MNEGLTDTERAIGALCYVGPLFVISRVVLPGSDFCRFHFRQGLVLFVLELVAAVFLAIVKGTLGLIPVLGTLVVAALGFVIWVVAFLVSLAGVASAVKGERWRIPLISEYADVVPI